MAMYKVMNIGMIRFSSGSLVCCSRNISSNQEKIKPIVAVHDADITGIPVVSTIVKPTLDINSYLALGKSRLSLLVVATAASGYVMAPGIIEPVTLCACLLGTGLTAMAANSINQIMEQKYDSKMMRTQARPLVTGKLSTTQAAAFATVTATSGTALLLSTVNPLSGILAASNIALYTGVYTPMKRMSLVNTWVGAVVGGIPPLIGWAAATGGDLNPGAFLLAFVLYSWQFPHFHALSWNYKSDYKNAGYKMASVENPNLCKRSSLNHSLSMLALCSVAPCTGLTEWFFVVQSLPLNVGLLYYSYKFYQNGDNSSSRKLFKYTLIHLPLVLLLMFFNKPDVDKSNKSLTEKLNGFINMHLSHKNE